MASKESRITFRPGNMEDKARERAKSMNIDLSEYLRLLIAADAGVCPTCGQEIRRDQLDGKG